MKGIRLFRGGLGSTSLRGGISEKKERKRKEEEEGRGRIRVRGTLGGAIEGDTTVADSMALENCEVRESRYDILVS